MKAKRFDQGEIRNAHIMEDGRLSADVIVSRVGVLTYVNSDGSLRRELRPPDEVLNQRSLQTMKMIPITLGHPEGGIVNSDNSKDLQVGQTGENVRGDSPFIKSSITVNQQRAIENIQAGNQELSLGYELELDETPGEYFGERYDAIQKNITYNHLAIVPQARAGKEARITLDSADARQTNQTQKEPEMSDKNLLKVNLDGIEYDASPEVKKALEKAETRVDSLTVEITTEKDSNSKLQANFDSQEEELKTLKATNNDEAIQAGVAVRLKLEREAVKHLDNADEIGKQSVAEIKEAVIMKAFPKANLDGKKENDVYMDARYDSALEVLVSSEANTNLQSQGQQLNGDQAGGDNTVRNSDSAAEDYKKRTLAAHNSETK